MTTTATAVRPTGSATTSRVRHYTLFGPGKPPPPPGAVTVALCGAAFRARGTVLETLPADACPLCVLAESTVPGGVA